MKKIKPKDSPITSYRNTNTVSQSPSFLNSKFKILNPSPYTLLEILMVIVIMALLMASAMPAFVDMMKGQGVEASARNLGQILKLARSHAINNREYVAVLMPQSNKNNAAYPTMTGNHLPSQYYDRSYRVCIVQKNASSGYDFKRWLPGENWQFLSTGVAIFETDTDQGVTFNSAKPTNNDTCTRINKIKLGDINSALDDTNSTDDTNDVAGIVFHPTGKSKHAGADGGYFIEIGEGTFSGSDLVVTNQNTGAVVSIKVADYTGRVSYGTE
jgi:type II secretory pathway pseudopilin PulG